MTKQPTDLYDAMVKGLADIPRNSKPAPLASVIALAAIAQELRTANLLAAAELFQAGSDPEEIGWKARVEAAERLGYPAPARPDSYNVMDSIG